MSWHTGATHCGDVCRSVLLYRKGQDTRLGIPRKEKKRKRRVKSTWVGGQHTWARKTQCGQRGESKMEGGACWTSTNLGKFPQLKKKSCPENSLSLISFPLSPLSHPHCPRSHSLWSNWLNLLNTWLWPAYLVYHIWGWRCNSLAPLVTLRALLQPSLFFFSQRWCTFFENVLKVLKWLFFTGLWGQQLFPILALEPSATHSNFGASLFSLSPHKQVPFW